MDIILGRGAGEQELSTRVSITGASRGIGKAVAERFALDSFEVTLGYRERIDEAEQAMSEIREKAGAASLLPFDRRQVNYSTSKAGLIGATRSLALELAKRRITVNTVAPGLIETDITAELPTEQLTQMIPTQRLGSPDEVASVAGFLFSEGASYITGEVIGVNGGLG